MQLLSFGSCVRGDQNKWLHKSQIFLFLVSTTISKFWNFMFEETRDVSGLPVYVWKGALTLIRDQFQIVLHEPLHDYRPARCQWLIIDDRIISKGNRNITCFVTVDFSWKVPNSIRIWRKVPNRTKVWFAESWRVERHEGDLEYEGDGRHGQDEGDEHPLPRDPLLLFNFVDHELFNNRIVPTRSR